MSRALQIAAEHFEKLAAIYQDIAINSTSPVERVAALRRAAHFASAACRFRGVGLERLPPIALAVEVKSARDGWASCLI